MMMMGLLLQQLGNISVKIKVPLRILTTHNVGRHSFINVPANAMEEGHPQNKCVMMLNNHLMVQQWLYLVAHFTLCSDADPCTLP